MVLASSMPSVPRLWYGSNPPRLISRDIPVDRPHKNPDDRHMKSKAQLLRGAYSIALTLWCSSFLVASACPPLYEDVCIHRCRDLIKYGYYVEALDSANEALSAPRLSNIRRMNGLQDRARAYVALKQFDNALADLNEAISIGAYQKFFTINSIYADRAAIHLRKKNYTSALADFDIALAQQPAQQRGQPRTAHDEERQRWFKGRAECKKALGRGDWQSDENQAATTNLQEPRLTTPAIFKPAGIDAATQLLNTEARIGSPFTEGNCARMLTMGRSAMQAQNYKAACEFFTKAMPKVHRGSLPQVILASDSSGFAYLNDLQLALLERSRAFIALGRIDLALNDLNKAISDNTGMGSQPDLYYHRAVVFSMLDEDKKAQNDIAKAEQGFYRHADIDMFDKARRFRQALSGTSATPATTPSDTDADSNSKSISGRLVRFKP